MMPHDPMHRTRLDILGDVEAECRRQLDKWGIQRHPDGTGLRPAMPLAFLRVDESQRYGALADQAKDVCDYLHRRCADRWDSILMEEFFEAMAEDPDSPELEEELIQVAAVAVTWLADLRTRKGVQS